MTKIKLCGLSRPEDIQVANELAPDYVGFVFWPRSSRHVTRERARELRGLLDPAILSVGVFVDEDARVVAGLLRDGIIDIAQLHGTEDEAYLAKLRKRTDKPIIQAFKVRSAEDAARAERSRAELVLLDAGMGSGERFDWSLVADVERPYLLAGGLSAENVADAISQLHPYGLDVSSAVETGGVKDPDKMRAFVASVRGTAGGARRGTCEKRRPVPPSRHV